MTTNTIAQQNDNSCFLHVKCSFFRYFLQYIPLYKETKNVCLGIWVVFVNTSVSQQNLDGRRVCAFSGREQKRFNPGQNVFGGWDYADSYKKLGPEAFADIFAPKK